MSETMSETVSEKFQRRCSLFLYAFSPTHIKDVFIAMATTYETPKIITINSYPIALTCRFVQLLILIYAFGYIMWYKRGYQERDPSLISSVTLKVKGIGSHGQNPSVTLDNADYIIPPQENNAVFIMTNLISTDQRRARCGEGVVVKEAECSNDAICEAKRHYPPKSNGRWTGKCRVVEKRCEMEGWCPVENDWIQPQPIKDSLNFTIFLKNFVEFTRFNISRNNILNESRYFKDCLYHPIHNNLCPIFRLGDILEMVETNATERKLMLESGAVVRIKIDWMCNLDLGLEECKPKYSFGRLDSKYSEEIFSIGFNFRYASHWKMNNDSHRTLIKAYGLRLIVTVNGEAGRFDLLVLTLNIGSMVGVLGLATFICDIVALYFSERGSIYRKQKFQSVRFERKSRSSAARSQSITQARKMTEGLIYVNQMNNHEPQPQETEC